MRRLALLPALLLVATACDYGPQEDEIYTGGDGSGYGPQISAGRLASSSYIDVEFQGIALQNDADVGIAGMAGMTCEYFTAMGNTGTDVDVTTGTETVDGSRPATGLSDPWGDSVVVLGHSDHDEVHEVGMPSGVLVQSWKILGAVTSAYVPEGVAVLRSELEDGCFVDVLGVGRTAVDGHFCSNVPSVVHTATGLVLVDEAGAVDVTAGVATPLPLSGEIAALDAASGRLVLADGQYLVSTNLDGTQAWALDMGGTIHGLAPLKDQFLLSVRQDYRTSRLVTVDAAGAIGSDQTLARDAGRVWASEDGLKAALSSPAWSDTFTVAP
jgi:hypothetical protein